MKTHEILSFVAGLSLIITLASCSSSETVETEMPPEDAIPIAESGTDAVPADGAALPDPASTDTASATPDSSLIAPSSDGSTPPAEGTDTASPYGASSPFTASASSDETPKPRKSKRAPKRRQPVAEDAGALPTADAPQAEAPPIESPSTDFAQASPPVAEATMQTTIPEMTTTTMWVAPTTMPVVTTMPPVSRTTPSLTDSSGEGWLGSVKVIALIVAGVLALVGALLMFRKKP